MFHVDAKSVAAIVTAGAVVGTLALTIADRFRSRQRAGVTAAIDDAWQVRAEVANTKDKKNWVRGIKVVSVKPRIYGFLRNLRFDDITADILLLKMNVPDHPLEANESFETCLVLPREHLLPAPWNPFASFRNRALRRGELRLQVTLSSNPAKPLYMRLKRKKGMYKA
jgi:hypothetical protein